MEKFYARFQSSSGSWFPGDYVRNGQSWISLDGYYVSVPRIVHDVGRAREQREIVLFVHGFTAAQNFAEALVTNRRLPLVEVEIVEVENGQEIPYLKLRMTNAIIDAVTRTTPPGQVTLQQQVRVWYEEIKWIYTPHKSHPTVPSHILHLRRSVFPQGS